MSTPYTTKAAILTQMSDYDLASLTNNDDQAQIVGAQVDKCIEWAQIQIDRKLRGVYSPLPFDPVPSDIADIALDLVVFRLHELRGLQATVMNRWDRAMAALKDLRDGRTTLDAEAQENVVVSSTAVKAVIATAPLKAGVFTSEKLSGY